MRRDPGLMTASESSALKAVAAIAAVVFALAAYRSPVHGGAGVLIAGVFFSELSLGAMVFMAAQSVAAAGWPTLFRRVPEAMTGFLPVGAAATAVLVLFAGKLYPWAAPGASAWLGDRAWYLSLGAFAAVSAVGWTAWIIFARKLVGMSRAQDASGDASVTRRAKLVSAAFLVVFALTFTFCSVDWLMSLEPKWTSTLYPWYVFAGLFEAALAAMTVLTILLHRRGFFPELNDHHRHNLGKYLFAFTCFWAYLWFSQYLLIWYSDIPDEVVHFLGRSEGAWRYVFWMNPIASFAIPFLFFLPVKRKAAESTLLGGALFILCARVLDLVILVEPTISARPSLGLAEIAALLAGAAIFLLAFDRAFASAAPEPAKDPYIEESRHFAGV